MATHIGFILNPNTPTPHVGRSAALGRAEWARVFGLRLPRPSSWPSGDNTTGGTPRDGPRDDTRGGTPRDGPRDNAGGGTPRDGPRDNTRRGTPRDGPRDNAGGGTPRDGPRDDNTAGDGSRDDTGRQPGA